MDFYNSGQTEYLQALMFMTMVGKGVQRVFELRKQLHFEAEKGRHPIYRLLAPHYTRSALTALDSCDTINPEMGMIHRSTHRSKGTLNTRPARACNEA